MAAPRFMPSECARLLVTREVAKVNLEVAQARVRMAHALPMARQVELVNERDNALAVAEEFGVFEGVS